MRTYVLHIDLDQFIVAVELLRHPELRGRPVVVGGRGDPSERGVVSSASYEARAFGVVSGMPLRTAARRCPEAIFLPVDRAEYERASTRVMTALAGLGFPFENAGWDEAFLEVHTDDPEAIARTSRDAVMEAAALSCAVGIGHNKLQAKLATEFAKPGGISRLTDDNWREIMDARKPDALWGVGRKRAQALAELGIVTVRDLAATDEQMLAEVFGPSTGPWLKAVAQGRGGPVHPVARARRSLGREVTYQKDLSDIVEIRSALESLAQELARDLTAGALRTSQITLKIRFAPFETHSHSVRLERPSNDFPDIRDAALNALDDMEVTRPVRLLGLRSTLPNKERAR
jgi:DNA polymerase-4